MTGGHVIELPDGTMPADTPAQLDAAAQALSAAGLLYGWVRDRDGRIVRYLHAAGARLPVLRRIDSDYGRG